VAAFATLVMEQDATACELNQQGMGSIRHKQGVLMGEEYEFQEWMWDGGAILGLLQQGTRQPPLIHD